MPLVYVIPDLHGQFQALERMLTACGLLGPDDAWAGPPDATLVQLGDLVDRGPHSRACVERLKGLAQRHPQRVRVLCGNHEQMILSEDREMQRLWLASGGRQTLEDYGADFEALCRGTGAHAQWFRSLPLRWDQDGVLFCHAGLHPSDPEGRSERGLLWARPPLIRGSFRGVVSGHTRTRSRRVEMEDGIFRTDIGLGDPADGQRLEMLRLETKTLQWEALAVEGGLEKI
jgi:serine/threonine protein phosphatase 1